MLGRIEARLRRLRRNLSRSVWLSRLLRLPVSEGAPSRPGLTFAALCLHIDTWRWSGVPFYIRAGPPVPCPLTGSAGEPAGLADSGS